MTRKDEIQAEIARLQAELDALDKPLPAMLPMDGEWFIGAEWLSTSSLGTIVTAGRDQNVFPTKESAEAYRDAFSVMLELRRQPGSGAQRVGFVINDAGCTQHVVTNMCFALCPPFPTEELAEAARDAVGRDRIVAAYKTLTGVV